MRVCIQLFRERLSRKVHATILKGIVGGFEFSFFQRNLKELARKAMEMCLRVLKESNKSRFDSYSRQEQCIDHIPYYPFRGCRVHMFSDKLSRNSCMWPLTLTVCRCRTDSRSFSVRQPFKRIGYPFEQLRLSVPKKLSSVWTARTSPFEPFEQLVSRATVPKQFTRAVRDESVTKCK